MPDLEADSAQSLNFKVGTPKSFVEFLIPRKPPEITSALVPSIFAARAALIAFLLAPVRAKTISWTSLPLDGPLHEESQLAVSQLV